jgi:hypothetical protein
MAGRRVKIRFPTEPVKVVFRDIKHTFELETTFEVAVEDVERFIEAWMFGQLSVWNVSAKSYTRANRKTIEKMKQQQLEYAGYESGRTNSRPLRDAPRRRGQNRRPNRGRPV